MTPGSAREAREQAAALYKPDSVQLLLVGEAPPSAADRYFYLPDVATHDSLFRYVARGTLGLEPTRTNKRDLLAKLRAAGVFLIDLFPEPVTAVADPMRAVPDLIERVVALSPGHIILIKSAVYDFAFKALFDSGLPVVDERIPFPGSGQQACFTHTFDHALRAIGWEKAA